jgi:hypothetical protein
VTLAAGAKMLRFKVPSDKKRYTLCHKRPKGSRQTIFKNRRLQDLTAAGHRSKTAPYGYRRLDGQLPSTLPAKYRAITSVDQDLVQVTPVLVDLLVEDPEL